jgi:hypothetical protein
MKNERHAARTLDKAGTDANADHDRGSRGIAAGDRRPELNSAVRLLNAIRA